MGVKSPNSCRDIFKRLVILTLPCGYMYPLIQFVTRNKEHFQTSVNTNNVFKNQLLTSCAFRKAYVMLGLKISVTFHLISECYE
jgi:hypothetical protein